MLSDHIVESVCERCGRKVETSLAYGHNLCGHCIKWIMNVIDKLITQGESV